MKTVIGDSNLIIKYIQQKLFEQYNPDIKTNLNYYEQFEMNYGFAHYVAKYLNYMYPHIKETDDDEYNPVSSDDIRSLNNTITVMNYFLCDNRGNRLLYPQDINNINSLYRKLYSSFQITNKRYYNTDDPPLFLSNNFSIHPNPTPTIYCLEKWFVDKEICEIDDFILSYLLGRTITPNSSMEDIYYVQKLFMSVKDIPKEDRGRWFNNTTGYNLSRDYIIPYQRSCLCKYNEHSVFITGYFDIFTESSILKERGVSRNGIQGL